MIAGTRRPPLVRRAPAQKLAAGRSWLDAQDGADCTRPLGDLSWLLPVLARQPAGTP